MILQKWLKNMFLLFWSFDSVVVVKAEFFGSQGEGTWRESWHALWREICFMCVITLLGSLGASCDLPYDVVCF